MKCLKWKKVFPELMENLQIVFVRVTVENIQLQLLKADKLYTFVVITSTFVIFA